MRTSRFAQAAIGATLMLVGAVSAVVYLIAAMLEATFK